ncbi:MAG: corrinoid protein [Deltaproteobacteria bacterium]|nr:corrinoid protein [Deltaproteobacteria bacterium]
MIDQNVINEAKEVLIKANKERALALSREAVDAGQDPFDLMNQAFIPAINAVGVLFGRGQLFLPELIKSADTMKAVTDFINEALGSRIDQQQKKGTVLIATVKGDVHDIGKCIVVSLMQANGLTVHDLGRDVDTDRIIEEAVKVNADIIGTSALLTTTMPRQKDLEDALKSAGLRDRFKTMVGGAPVTPRWAVRIGADAYAEDAQDGVLKAQALLAQK